MTSDEKVLAKRRRVGMILSLTGMLFVMIEAKYFGSGFWPQSYAEIICDQIGTIMQYTGIGILIGARKA